MKIEIVTPEEYMGDVMGDLNRRRGYDGKYGNESQCTGDKGQSAIEPKCLVM